MFDFGLQLAAATSAFQDDSKLDNPIPTLYQQSSSTSKRQMGIIKVCACVTPAAAQMFCRSGLEPDDAWGANAELRTDTRQLLGSRYSAPLSLSGSVMGHRAETMAAVSAAMQVGVGGWGGAHGARACHEVWSMTHTVMLLCWTRGR